MVGFASSFSSPLDLSSLAALSAAAGAGDALLDARIALSDSLDEEGARPLPAPGCGDRLMTARLAGAL